MEYPNTLNVLESAFCTRNIYNNNISGVCIYMYAHINTVYMITVGVSMQIAMHSMSVFVTLYIKRWLAKHL